MSDSIAVSSNTALEGFILVSDSLGERRFGTPDFPLSFGGPGSQVVLAGRPEGPEVYLGLHEDQLFVQPAENAGDVLHNGIRIQRSAWLKPGDVINLGPARLRISRPDQLGAAAHLVQVDDGSTGNITAPPIITNAPRVQGESDSEADPIAAVAFRAAQAAPSRRVGIKLNPLRIGLGVLSVVLLGVLWFIFTATSVGISTNPGSAQIEVAGGLPAIPVGGRFMVQPGQYQVTARLEGYAPAQQTIKVTNAPNQRFDLNLAKLPGKLRIELPGPGEVTVDGKLVGSAPGPFDLSPGSHDIQIAAERYQPFAGKVEIEGGGKAQTLKPELVPGWAEVSFASEPVGAVVLVDGQERGRTPITTQIMAGNHPVELRLAGFKPWTADVQAQANVPQQFGPIKLGLPDASLAVRSEPAGASVSVSGVYRGQTPLSIELRPEIGYSVVLSKAGYETVTREVKLGSNEQRSLSVPMAGVFGEIAVRAQPGDAQVFVDGKNVGPVNQTLRLIATTHQIEIRKPGFVDFKTTVTPRPGLQQVVQTTLLTAEQTRLAATPDRVVSKGANQQLKLIPLGRFTMGSPRREPGRRANEGQRDVEFKRPFYMGAKEVTNAEFRKFKAGHRSGIAGNTSLELDNQPVVNVTWQDAAEYCNWLSEKEGLPAAYRKEGDTLVPVTPMTTGYRLPTDAEWEWVARYTDGSKLRRYPWGDALPVQAGSGNYADKTANIVIQDVIPDYDDGYPATAPVGKFPANSLGLFDFGGNVAEWIHDYYAVGGEGLAVDPMGPADPPSGKQHAIRGSSWRQSSVTDLRLAARDFGEVQRNDLGFRIARYVE